MKCRHCKSELTITFLDLASAPPSNAYLTEKQLKAPEKWFPLKILVCEKCWLVQTEDFTQAQELFDAEYSYFSAFSTSWLKHCEDYVCDMVERFNLTKKSNVVEVAANDGYLLQYVKAREICCTGIEPTASTAAAARSKGINIVEEFFGLEFAKKFIKTNNQADLMIANNVLAHVPDINDFVSGFAIVLKPQGVVTFEFPHLYQLVKGLQFDTMYHEHFSYLSLSSVNTIFNSCGLKIFDVQELPTHGGSLRVFAQRLDTGTRPVEEHVKKILTIESKAGMLKKQYYTGFQAKVDKIKDDFLIFLLNAKREGKKVAAYGAAAKGNTILNYAGIRQDLISFVVDMNPAKQNKYLPGSRIPIVNESHLKTNKPDYIIIFPWNIKEEIMKQLNYVKDWKAKFVIAVPELSVI